MRLSIVISTRNRAGYIGETLDSILSQLPLNAELVVFDGASSDATPGLLASYAARHSALHYIRATTNSGIDADYDNAVQAARGDYVWLMGDDDLLLPGGIARVLELIARNPDLVVVDSEVRDATLTRTLDKRRMPFTGERTYGPTDGDALLADTGNALSFIGGTIVRRALWLARERTRYYGTMFIHVGVIFQAPLSAIAIAEPLVAIRFGNASWSARSFDIWMRLWPELIWSLPLADWAKHAVVPREPWRSLKRLVPLRAVGSFDYAGCRRFVTGRRIGPWRWALMALAATPGRVVNVAALLHLSARGHARGPGGYALLGASRYANAVGRWIART